MTNRAQDTPDVGQDAAAHADVALRVEYGRLCLRNRTGWLLWSKTISEVGENDLWPDLLDAILWNMKAEKAMAQPLKTADDYATGTRQQG